MDTHMPFTDQRESSTEPKTLPQRVYAVRCPEDTTVLVAIDVSLQGEYVRWFDTVKERMMRYVKKELTPEGHFVFTRQESHVEGDQRVYEFIPMDLDVYNHSVKHRLIKGADFESTQDVIDAFLALLEDEL